MVVATSVVVEGIRLNLVQLNKSVPIACYLSLHHLLYLFQSSLWIQSLEMFQSFLDLARRLFSGVIHDSNFFHCQLMLSPFVYLAEQLVEQSRRVDCIEFRSTGLWGDGRTRRVARHHSLQSRLLFVGRNLTRTRRPVHPFLVQSFLDGVPTNRLRLSSRNEVYSLAVGRIVSDMVTTNFGNGQAQYPRSILLPLSLLLFLCLLVPAMYGACSLPGTRRSTSFSVVGFYNCGVASPSSWFGIRDPCSNAVQFRQESSRFGISIEYFPRVASV